jgi:hypothetical protein
MDRKDHSLQVHKISFLATVSEKSFLARCQKRYFFGGDEVVSNKSKNHKQSTQHLP